MFNFCTLQNISRFFLIFSIIVCFYNSHLGADSLKEAKKAYSQKQFQKSIKLFTEAAKAQPSNGEPYMYMGYIYETLKQYDTSIAYFRKAVDLNLNSKQKKNCLIKILIFYNYHGAWDYVVHYSNRYLKMESNKEVAKMRDRALGNRGSDPGKLSTTVTSHSSNGNAQTIAKENTKNTSKKTEVKKKSEKTPEKSLSTEEVKKPENSKEATLWSDTLRLIQSEDYTGAFRNLKKLLILSPYNSNYNYKAGIVNLRLGDLEQAISYFEIAKKHAPEKDSTLQYYIHLNEGQAYQKLGNSNEAEEHYIKAYNYQNSSTPLLALTKLKFEENEFNQALSYSENVLRNEPNNLEGLMYRGVSRVKLGNRVQGFKDLIQFSISIRKSYPDLKSIPSKYQDGILYLGCFYSNRSKYKIALKYLKAVQSSKMNSNTYSFSLGKTYFYTKKYDLALIHLERTKDLPAAHYLLGKIHAIQKNVNKAKEQLALAASKKEIYWIKARLDPNYRELMADPSFSDFVINKGETTIPEKTTIITTPPAETPKEEIKSSPQVEDRDIP